jgi:hypothetical protein
MPIRVYIFGGPLLSKPMGDRKFTNWGEAGAFIQQSAEAGLLTTVVHTDFEVSHEHTEELLTRLAKRVFEDRNRKR